MIEIVGFQSQDFSVQTPLVQDQPGPWAITAACRQPSVVALEAALSATPYSKQRLQVGVSERVKLVPLPLDSPEPLLSLLGVFATLEQEVVHVFNHFCAIFALRVNLAYPCARRSSQGVCQPGCCVIKCAIPVCSAFCRAWENFPVGFFTQM